MPQPRRRRVDRGHADQHPRPQPPAPERADIVGQRHLVARAAGDVVESGLVIRLAAGLSKSARLTTIERSAASWSAVIRPPQARALHRRQPIGSTSRIAANASAISQKTTGRPASLPSMSMMIP